MRSKKFKVCMLTHRFVPSIGGVQVATYELARRLVREGLEVEVHTSRISGCPDAECLEGIRVIRHRTLFTLFRAQVNPGIAIGLLKHRDADIVHVAATFPTVSELGLLVARMLRKPAVVAYPLDAVAPGFVGTVLQNAYSQLFAKWISWFATVIVTSTKSYAEASPVLARLRKRSVVIPIGVDLQRFNPNVDGREARRRFNISEQARVVLFVGRLVPHKGLEYLFRSVPVILRDYKDAVLMIVGEGELRNGLMDLTKRMGIEKNVMFTGPVDASLLPHCYAASDLFVLPSVSRLEAFGAVLVEALASGRPLVSTSIAGVREVLAPGVTGLTVRPKDSQSLAFAIRTLLSSDDVRHEMGRRARLLAEEKYDWDKVTKQYLELYWSISKHGPW